MRNTLRVILEARRGEDRRSGQIDSRAGTTVRVDPPTKLDPRQNIRTIAIIRALQQARLELQQGGKNAALGPVAQNLVLRVTLALDGSSLLQNRLRKALRLLLASEVPILSVQRLSHRVGWSQSTLRRDWERAAGKRLSLSLFLKLIVAARYQDLRDKHISASEAADRLGLTVKAVRKRCRRLRRDLRSWRD